MSVFRTVQLMRGRLFAAAAAFLLALACLALQGCVTNDETNMPWAAPAPGEGTMPLPSSLLRE
jgi:hypothetical protein